MIESPGIRRLTYMDKAITLVGTAHVSRESVELVGRVIEDEKPDTVCVELCPSRYLSITRRGDVEQVDWLGALRDKKTFFVLSNLLLTYFQKRIGEKLGVKPGDDMLRAIEAAEETGAYLHLADRDVRITLGRAWRLMSVRAKLKLLADLVSSVGEIETIKQADIEGLKERDVLDGLLEELGESFPDLRRIIIDERDQYLAHEIRTAPGERIVAVVGAGHLPGILKYWLEPIDMAALKLVPAGH